MVPTEISSCGMTRASTSSSDRYRITIEACDDSSAASDRWGNVTAPLVAACTSMKNGCSTATPAGDDERGALTAECGMGGTELVYVGWDERPEVWLEQIRLIGKHAADRSKDGTGRGRLGGQHPAIDDEHGSGRSPAERRRCRYRARRRCLALPGSRNRRPRNRDRRSATLPPSAMASAASRSRRAPRCGAWPTRPGRRLRPRPRPGDQGCSHVSPVASRNEVNRPKSPKKRPICRAFGGDYGHPGAGGRLPPPGPTPVQGRLCRYLIAPGCR